jgi:hypothetical protein
MRTILRWVMMAFCFVASSVGWAEQSGDLIGTWELVSRIDTNANGQVVSEPSLGSDPYGYLIYDKAGHVSAQLMARNRKSAYPAKLISADPNNTSATDGYDAYFGHYEVDLTRHTLTHILELALGPTDVGRRIVRRYQLEGDKLTIRFEPGAPGVTRTIIWRRVSS